jgi:NADH-quinone oxidoreductase subunit M
MLDLLFQSPLVTIIALLSLALGICVLLPAAQVATLRLVVLFTSRLVLFVGVCAAASFNKAQAGFQFLTRVNRLSEYNLSFTLGVDGISRIFILLTLFIFPLCFLAA